MPASLKALTKRMLLVGAAVQDVTPVGDIFLFGYPNVPRTSTGIHDPLLASAIVVQRDSDAVMFVSVDVIFLERDLVNQARFAISGKTGLAPSRIMITATHTHSGPATIRMISNADDVNVPPPDGSYLNRLTAGIVSAAIAAWENREPAEIAQVAASCPGLGGNRHDPTGTTIDKISILAARSMGDPARMLAVMYVNRVHPTVLHEASTLISGDYPGLCRRRLQELHYGDGCQVLSLLGAAGDQSPRHVVQANTFDEANRLGTLMADALVSAIEQASFTADVTIHSANVQLDLPLRSMPGVSEATCRLNKARQRLDRLRASDVRKSEIRTAECDVFGAEETLCIARVAEAGDLRKAAEKCLPAEIQLITLDSTTWVGWPGEVFAEYALRIYMHYPNCAVITLANGELQGYLVTEQAVVDRVYEASNALFASPQSGEILVAKTLALLAERETTQLGGLTFHEGRV